MMNPAAAELILEDVNEAMDLAIIETPWELYEKQVRLQSLVSKKHKGIRIRISAQKQSQHQE
jgi:hypothetical protein